MKITLKVVGNRAHAALNDKGEPVRVFTVAMRGANNPNDGALDFSTESETIAKRFVYDATLTVDLADVKAPPKPKAEKDE